MNHAVTLSGDQLIVLTASEYRDLVEDAGDAALADQAVRAQGNAPMMPAEFVDDILDHGMHPLTAWRKSAGLTQADLATRAGIRTATLADIEGRKIDPRLSTVKALAVALSLDIDDITE